MATARLQPKSPPEVGVALHDAARSSAAPAPPPVESIKRIEPTAPWRLGWLVTLVILAAMGGSGYYLYPRVKPYLFPNRAATPAAVRVIPVLTATAQRGDMELHLGSLGSVAGFNTVTIRSRVEGELIHVAFTEGQMVKEGELLAEIDPRAFLVQLKEAEAQLSKDEAVGRVALADYDRYKTLASTRSITQQELGAQKAVYEQSQATVSADKSRIESINLQLKYCKITSPLTGRIGLRTVDKGNIVRANDVNGLAVVTQLQPISVVFSIPQDEIPRVQKKMKSAGELVVDAFARDQKTLIATGKLTAIDNQVDATTGTVRLKAKFDNLDNALFPNQFVNARLGVETIPGAVIVPSAGVQRGPETSYVYVVKSDSTVEFRTIVAGPTEGERTAVLSGLEPGEVVVVDGVDKLQQGTKVAPREQGGAKKEQPETSPVESRPGGATLASPAHADGEKQAKPQEQSDQAGTDADKAKPEAKGD